ESYAYNLRNTLQDDKIKDKFQGEDKATLEKAVDEAISWLDRSHEASKEEFESKQKELEEVANPIMRRLYGDGGAGGAGGGFPGGGFPGGPGGFPGAGGDSGAGGAGPTVEEVD
ncbi:70-kilodalton heat shock protein, partial [Gonapodya sp. JEL0774]